MKFVFTFLFFILSVSLFSLDTADKLIKYSAPINLFQDIQSQEHKSISDFSTIYKDASLLNNFKYESDKEAIVPFLPVNNYWYSNDFSEEPFDGKIDMYVFGSPLPSLNVSLCIASIISILFLQYNKKRSKKTISEKSLI